MKFAEYTHPGPPLDLLIMVEFFGFDHIRKFATNSCGVSEVEVETSIKYNSLLNESM